MSNNKKKVSIKGKLLFGLIIGTLFVAIVTITLLSGNKVEDITNVQKANESTSVQLAEDMKIVKSEVTEKATFYPYQAGDTYMEVIAIKASDGTVRTALNTCQVCTGSGRAYYEQDGDVLVCQNCGNRFTVDQVEVEKGGCNPVPIFDGDTVEDDQYITISSSFLSDNKALFNNWKTRS